MYDITKEAQKNVATAGYTLTFYATMFVLSIVVIAIISFILLTFYNKKRPDDKKLSNVKIFLISFFIGWMITTLVFVYRIVVIGLSKLMGG
ncbi:MAG: hypothetical protein ABWJ98_02330 [Hydrogenothermaceae bacterium]